MNADVSIWPLRALIILSFAGSPPDRVLNGPGMALRDDAQRKELHGQRPFLRLLRRRPRADRQAGGLRLHRRIGARREVRSPAPRHWRVERYRQPPHEARTFTKRQPQPTLLIESS